MHRCLEITETLRNIFDFLVFDKPDGPPALTACARVCKAFYDPALDVLWRTQSSLVPLIKCMPVDLWIMEEQLSFVRDPVRTDWDRFVHHASRVRTFNTRAKASGSIPSTVLHALALHRPTLLLLPNLHSLISATSTGIPAAYIHLFVSSRLKTFWLHDMKYTKIEALSLLASLVRSSQSLTSVAICGPSVAGVAMTPAFSCLVSQLSHIQCFECNVTIITTEFVTNLGSMACLRELSLKCDSDMLAAHPTLTADPTVSLFPALHLLMIRTRFIDICTMLLMHKSAWLLRKIAITLDSPPNASAIERFIQILPKRCSHTALLNVSMVPNDPDCYSIRRARSKLRVNGDILEGLFVFRNLESIIITPFCVESLDNELLKDLAMAWPRLRHLDIGTNSTLLVRPRVTLDGLIPLIVHCPLLENLGIVLDTTVVRTEWGERPGRGASNHKISTLNVGNSPIASAEDVADFLSDLLPGVQKIQTVWHASHGVSEQNMGGHSDKARWTQVVKYLGRFASIRKQERSYQAKHGFDDRDQ